MIHTCVHIYIYIFFSLCIAQAVFEFVFNLTILLPQPPKCCYYRNASPPLAGEDVLRTQRQGGKCFQVKMHQPSSAGWTVPCGLSWHTPFPWTPYIYLSCYSFSLFSSVTSFARISFEHACTFCINLREICVFSMLIVEQRHGVLLSSFRCLTSLMGFEQVLW